MSAHATGDPSPVAWFAELDRFAEETWLEQGRHQPFAPVSDELFG